MQQKRCALQKLDVHRGEIERRQPARHSAHKQQRRPNSTADEGDHRQNNVQRAASKQERNDVGQCRVRSSALPRKEPAPGKIEQPTQEQTPGPGRSAVTTKYVSKRPIGAGLDQVGRMGEIGDGDLRYHGRFQHGDDDLADEGRINNGEGLRQE